ncbi:MFS transporter [uncultured Limosilactobacillus sp.]|uniref:MFS transporter n=1 Tax=uncultured Limosilactobacillus sp. TaxID=2837629 RepID=UPI00265F2BFD|nr:MFS transporter [uncultured Limosilactobacillus sp.]
MEMPIAESQINKRRLSLSLYMNYLIHGFGIIILAQNMVALGGTWQVPIKTVSFVISGIGIGRLVAYLITGTLADMLSRKLFVFIGMACYLIFALGMVITHSIPVAYGLAILAGIANSALDAGTYTTLVEMNNGKGYDTILIKGFVSIGEFILPLIVAALSANNLWFGWSFIVMAVLTIANMINMSTVKFPKIQRVTLRHHQQTVSQSKKSLRKVFATILLLGYGYTSMAVMIWFTQWITLFAQKSLGYGNLTAHTLLSLYSVGSIIGVITLFILLKRNINEMTLLISLNLVAVIALLIILIEGNNINLVSIASLVFGFSAAGGIMQTGLTVFMNLYPHHRGMVTGAFYFFGSIASFTVPLITGVLSTHSIQLAFAGDLTVALSGTVLMVVLALLNVKEKINNGTN